MQGYMRKKPLNSTGIGLVGVLLVVLVLAIVGGAGVYVYHHNHKAKSSTSNTPASNNNTGSTSTAKTDPYAGWKRYCDATTHSCIRYPATWSPVTGFPGAFENSAVTSYISLEAGTSKDQSIKSAYIVSVDKVTTTAGTLDIVGYAVGDKPQYSVYNASYVAENGIAPGATVNMVIGNYAFTAKVGTVSLVATPGTNGYAAVTTASQAKAWFNTSAAGACLKALQSFYYD
jgi:hypothetical protein